MENLHAATWQAMQARRQRLPHALLLTGQSGIGKFELAYRFVAGLLCESPENGGVPCGHCQACTWFEHRNHPDFRLLAPEFLLEKLGGAVEEAGGPEKTEKAEKKASQQITMDQVRALDGFLSVGTHRHGLRIILVYPAEAMNRNTANAILKSLEEPPPSTLFLMVSSDKNSLLPTILSRCQNLLVPIPGHDHSLDYVMQRAKVARPLAETALDLCGGSPVQAVTLATGLDTAWYRALFDALAAGGRLDVMTVAGELDKTFREHKEPGALRQTLEWIQKWTLDLALSCERSPVRFFKSHQDSLVRLTTSVSLPDLVRFYRQVLLPMRRNADHPVNTRLFLESLLGQYRALFVI